MTPKDQTALAGLIIAFAAATSPALGQEVADTADEEWIMLSGEIETILETAFVLDYGEDDITVEMDRFDWAIEGDLEPGDRVTVTGRMDRDFAAYKSIEAATVYLPRVSDFYFADPADEEGDYWQNQYLAPGRFGTGFDEGDWVSFTGRVVSIDGDEIMVATGGSTLRVDTSAWPGDLVQPSAEIGDRVSVTGEMDAADWFDQREIEADSVVTLNDRSR